MTEHTPGPWIHIPNENFRPGAVLIWTSKGPGHGAICELSGPNHYAETMAQHEANAALIAAAPDLLAAAEGVEWSVWNQTLVKMQCPTCFGLEPTHHDTCALDAAIKKAKGQQ